MLSRISLSLFAAALVSSPALAVDPSRLATADQNSNDWLTYHGSYRSYHFSPQEQINAGNVGKLSDDLDTQVNGARIDQLMGQTRELLHSLNHLSSELDREPTRLIFGDRRKGYTPQCCNKPSCFRGARLFMLLQRSSRSPDAVA